jgi:hypothetical protein
MLNPVSQCIPVCLHFFIRHADFDQIRLTRDNHWPYTSGNRAVSRLENLWIIGREKVLTRLSGVPREKRTCYHRRFASSQMNAFQTGQLLMHVSEALEHSCVQKTGDCNSKACVSHARSPTYGYISGVHTRKKTQVTLHSLWIKLSSSALDNIDTSWSPSLSCVLSSEQTRTSN